MTYSRNGESVHEFTWADDFTRRHGESWRFKGIDFSYDTGSIDYLSRWIRGEEQKVTVEWDGVKYGFDNDEMMFNPNKGGNVKMPELDIVADTTEIENFISGFRTIKD